MGGLYLFAVRRCAPTERDERGMTAGTSAISEGEAFPVIQSGSSHPSDCSHIMALEGREVGAARSRSTMPTDCSGLFNCGGEFQEFAMDYQARAPEVAVIRIMAALEISNSAFSSSVNLYLSASSGRP